MKKILILITLFVTAFISNAEDCSTDYNTDLVEEVDEDEIPDDIPNQPNKHRIPPRPIRCSIKLSTNEVIVSSTLGGEINRYEIWDADNTYCLFAASEADDFCVQLGMFNQAVIIKLVTETSTYKGCFNK